MTQVLAHLSLQRPIDQELRELLYLWTREGWLYVCAVLDLFTHRIVGWAIAEHMTRQLVLEALQMAHATRKPGAELIFHSDRGSQYASAQVRAAAEGHAPIHQRHGQLL